MHEVMRDSPGTAACLLGNIAIVRGALEAGVQFFSCYPGTPSSEVGDTFARIHEDADVLFEYSVNEKVAVEVAFGASLAGARSMCSMKHLGLNYAGDPISTMPYVGVEGGMVIVSAGDPSAITSPNEQDQRHFHRFLYYPIFDPATPRDAHEMTRFAFPFSEKTRLPVIMRPTTRVCHVSGMITMGDLPEARREIAFEKNPSRHVPLPLNARRMRVELIERFKKAEALLAESPFFPRVGEGRRGIVASGVAHAYAQHAVTSLGLEDDVSLLQIGAYPIPEAILVPFIESVDEILVVEELTPVVEDQVTLTAHRSGRLLPIHGKHTGHFPLEFEYGPDMVEDAIRAYVGMDERAKSTVTVPDLPPRPPVLCPGCPHRASFHLVHKVFGKKTVYHNDIGCYTLGYGIPLDSCDVLLCMGSSISQASGVSRTTGQRTVAYLGDSTFFHSGLPPLANAVQADDQVTIVILNNYVTAMTGFQPSVAAAPESAGLEGKGTASMGLSIEDAVRGLGVKEVYSVDPFDREKTLAALRQAKKSSGLNVVISNAGCVVHGTRVGTHVAQTPLEIDQEACNECTACVHVLGCPALTVQGGRYEIEWDLCDGCGICAELCPKDAIVPAGGDDA